MIYLDMASVNILTTKMLEDLKIWWEELMYKCSSERKELAVLRLAAHKTALEKNLPSPYTNPELYDYNWNYLRSRAH